MRYVSCDTLISPLSVSFKILLASDNKVAEQLIEIVLLVGLDINWTAERLTDFDEPVAAERA